MDSAGRAARCPQIEPWLVDIGAPGSTRGSRSQAVRLRFAPPARRREPARRARTDGVRDETGAPQTHPDAVGAFDRGHQARRRPVPPRTARAAGSSTSEENLFRFGALQAGAVVLSDGRTTTLKLADDEPTAVPASARDELARRFAILAEPADPAHLAGWLPTSPAAANRMWATAHAAAAARNRPETHTVSGVRLLQPNDPLLRLVDRELLTPDAAHRKELFGPLVRRARSWKKTHWYMAGKSNGQPAGSLRTHVAQADASAAAETPGRGETPG